MWRGKLRSLPKPSEITVKALNEITKCICYNRTIQFATWLHIVCILQVVIYLGDCVLNVFLFIGPCVHQRGNKFKHSGSVSLTSFWEIGSCKKRLLLWGHNNSQWPPASSCHCLADRHIQMINLRHFLSVYFNRYKIIVH